MTSLVADLKRRMAVSGEDNSSSSTASTAKSSGQLAISFRDAANYAIRSLDLLAQAIKVAPDEETVVRAAGVARLEIINVLRYDKETEAKVPLWAKSALLAELSSAGMGSDPDVDWIKSEIVSFRDRLKFQNLIPPHARSELPRFVDLARKFSAAKIDQQIAVELWNLQVGLLNERAGQSFFPELGRDLFSDSPTDYQPRFKSKVQERNRHINDAFAIRFDDRFWQLLWLNAWSLNIDQDLSRPPTGADASISEAGSEEFDRVGGLVAMAASLTVSILETLSPQSAETLARERSAAAAAAASEIKRLQQPPPPDGTGWDWRTYAKLGAGIAIFWLVVRGFEAFNRLSGR